MILWPLCLVAACSADEGNAGGRGQGVGHVTAGAGAAPVGAAGAGDQPGFNNTSGQPSVPTGAATGAGGASAGGGMDGTVSNLEPVAIDGCGADNAAGFDQATIDTLRAGGNADGVRYLYPYDGTVFPRGMLAPEVMWDGADGSGVYIHIESSLFEYEGCLPVTEAGVLQLPQDVWDTAGFQTTGPGDPFTVELTVWTGSEARGPITEQLVIAQATLEGSIYYNSYSSGGVIFRIPAGGTAEAFLGGTSGALGCYGCHTVSANGERMISHTGGEPGAAYALDAMAQPGPAPISQAPLAGFTGLSPDGSVYIAGAHPAGAVRPQGVPQEGFLVNDAALYETDSGALVMGSGIPPGAMMPTFSPDGTRIAFNDFGAGAGYGLAVMDYDAAARTATNHRVIYTDTDRYPGWPFFLPDAQAVIFARGVNPGFSGAAAGIIPLAPGPESDLYIVDVDTGTATILARAMGLDSPDDQTGYTPFGADDLHKHYYPTVSPVPAGGYFWLFFDSMRNYGNKGLWRQLWGSAIRVSPDGSYEGDPSHPAFYLPGQEFAAANHRAFAALDACRKDGNSCTSGVDCCGGFCFIPDDLDGEFGRDPVGTCSSDVPSCAKWDERCISDADCCPPETEGAPANTCIGGVCGRIILD